MAKEFEDREKEILKSYEKMPSPRGSQWREYLKHQSKLMKEKFAVYTNRRYARLDFDKHIKTSKQIATMARRVTKNKPSLVALGAGYGDKMARKLANGIKNLDHSDVVFVNVDVTSQTCPNCFKKFPRYTKRHRFKVCRGCTRDAVLNFPMPELIVTHKSKKEMKELTNNELLVRNQNKHVARVYRDPESGELQSMKKNYFKKNWPVKPVNGNQMEHAAAATDETLDDEVKVEDLSDFTEKQLLDWLYQQHCYFPGDEQPPKKKCKFVIVWQRDIAACKCILYKGKYGKYWILILVSVLIYFFISFFQLIVSSSDIN